MQSALLSGLVLIIIAVTGWMKLISYAHTNKDLRELLKAGEKVQSSFILNYLLQFVWISSSHLKLRDPVYFRGWGLQFLF